MRPEALTRFGFMDCDKSPQCHPDPGPPPQARGRNFPALLGAERPALACEM